MEHQDQMYDFKFLNLNFVFVKNFPLLYFANNININMTNHFAAKSILVCSVYALVSILQTLNSRYMYQTLHFDYYSFIFATQRIVIIVVFYFMDKRKLSFSLLTKVLPYSAFMCTSNILSSYCLTIMPMAAFLAFKKFIIVFILGVSIAASLPVTTNRIQYFCIFGIVLGGALVGERDMISGNFIGYISCIGFDMSQAMSLQYAAYLFKNHGFQPQQLLMYNAIVSLPYYLTTMSYEAQFDDIYRYFVNDFSYVFLAVFLFSILLACSSELSASYIAMKISPFQKATVSNIKDLILMTMSVYFFSDFILTYISGSGMILCLICSFLFTIQELQIKNKQIEKGQRLTYQAEQENNMIETSNIIYQIQAQLGQA